MIALLRLRWIWPLLLLAAGAAAPLQAAETAVVQEILDGRELFIDLKQARLKQKAVTPQVMSTGNSRGQLLFGSGAAGRLNRFSLLKLGSNCFLMEKGQILVSGQQNACTRSARMSVRGTNFVVEVKDNGSTELAVLEGSVEVEPLRDGEPTGQPVQTVEAGEKLELSAEGVILTLLKLTAGDYTSLLEGPLFSGFRSPLPGFDALEREIRAVVPGVTIPSIPAAPAIPSFPGFRLF